MTSDTNIAEAAYDPQSDDTVARVPVGPSSTEHDAGREQTSDDPDQTPLTTVRTDLPIDVDLADGSSLVMPAQTGSSLVMQTQEGSSVVSVPSPRAPSTDIRTGGPGTDGEPSNPTAFFMKPMPRKRGSSLVTPEPERPSSAPSRLWQQLTVEFDDDSAATHTPVPLEHFEVHRLIGRGGMGAVFEARDTRLNRTVALKVLAPEHATTPTSVDRFRNEARAAARLDHDNVARVHYLGGQLASAGAPAVGTTPALPFIAFEFVEGKNVRELIRERGPFPPSEALRFALQLTHALRHTNACGVVHRDIKPSNVIITPKGRAKLVDLGLARTEDPDASQELTVAGTTLGTFDYISPEQAKDPRDVDIRSDIYSLGCTLFHMVTGQPPYPSGTMLQKLLDHQDRVVPDAHTINRRVPPALSDLIKRMMDSQPDVRPQSPEELLVALSEIAKAAGLRAPSGEGFVWTKREAVSGEAPWRQHLGWVIAAGLLCFVAVFADQFAAPQPVPVTLDELTRAGTSDIEPSSPRAGSASDSLNEKFEIIVGPAEATPAPPPSRPATAGSNASSEPIGVSPTDSTGSERLVATDAVAASEMTDSASVDPAPASSTEAPTEVEIATDVVTTAAVSPPFVVVSNKGRTAYETLEEAISNITDDAKIEVQRGGVISELNRRIRVANGKSIEIYCAEGLTQRPVLRFVEPLTASTAGVRLFELTGGGSVFLYDVDLEIVVGSRPSNRRWSVFSLGAGATVELDGVTVTVNNKNATDVSVFQIANTTGESALVSNAFVKHSIVRGDATLIRTDGSVSLDAPIFGSAIAISGPLFSVTPTEMPMQSIYGSELSLHIDDSTVLSPTSIFSVVANDSERVPSIRIDASNSVFSLLERDRAFLSMSGSLYREDFDELLVWDGTRNFISGEVAWEITPSGSPKIERSLDEWASYWGAASKDEALPYPAIIGEKSYRVDGKTLETFVLADFTPIADNANPILKAAPGRAAGVPSTRAELPKLVK